MKSKNATIMLILLTLGINGGWGHPEFKTRERLPFQYRRFPPPVVPSGRNDALPPSRSLTLPNFDGNYSAKKSEDLLVASANLINPVGFDFMKILIPQRSPTYFKSFRPVIPLAWVDLPHFDKPVFGQESPSPVPVFVVKQKPSEKVEFSRQLLDPRAESSKNQERNGRKLVETFDRRSQFDGFSHQQPHQVLINKAEDKNSSSGESKNYASDRPIIGFSIDPDRMALNYAESTTILPSLKAVPTVATRPTAGTSPTTIKIPTTLKILTIATPTTTTTARTTSTSTGRPVERFITNRNDNQSQDSVFSESKKEERRTENGRMVGLANPIAAATVNRPAFIATARAASTITNSGKEGSKSSSNYEYGYSVSNLETKDVKSHSERREGDLVHGEYSVLEPDGYTRIVKYFVDSGGFHASVRRIRI